MHPFEFQKKVMVKKQDGTKVPVTEYALQLDRDKVDKHQGQNNALKTLVTNEDGDVILVDATPVHPGIASEIDTDRHLNVRYNTKTLEVDEENRLNVGRLPYVPQLSSFDDFNLKVGDVFQWIGEDDPDTAAIDLDGDTSYLQTGYFYRKGESQTDGYIEQTETVTYTVPPNYNWITIYKGSPAIPPGVYINDGTTASVDSSYERSFGVSGPHNGTAFTGCANTANWSQERLEQEKISCQKGYYIGTADGSLYLKTVDFEIDTRLWVLEDGTKVRWSMHVPQTITVYVCYRINSDGTIDEDFGSLQAYNPGSAYCWLFPSNHALDYFNNVERQYEWKLKRSTPTEVSFTGVTYIQAQTAAYQRINTQPRRLSYTELNDLPFIPTKTSDLENDAKFVNEVDLSKKEDNGEVRVEAFFQAHPECTISGTETARFFICNAPLLYDAVWDNYFDFLKTYYQNGGREIPYSGDRFATLLSVDDNSVKYYIDGVLYNLKPYHSLYNKSLAELFNVVNADDISGKINITEKGEPLGVAELDTNGKVPSSQLPSYVDDVLTFSAYSSFPTAGEDGKIYIDAATNKTYRWSGSAYVEISPSLALGETSSTAYRGDRGKTAYDHAAAKGSAFSSGLYKITTNAQGHVIAATPVTKADITALGIPGTDTNTTYSFSDKNPTLAWGTKSTVATVGGVDIHVTMPANPNTNTVTTINGKTGAIAAADMAAVLTAAGYKLTDNNTTYSFSDKNPTLAWGTKSTVATVGGVDIHVTMPANPNTNTWRGIQNNLTSDSTTDSLAAAQGKALKALIDKKMDNTVIESLSCGTGVSGMQIGNICLFTISIRPSSSSVRVGVPGTYYQTEYFLAGNVNVCAVFKLTTGGFIENESTITVGTAYYGFVVGVRKS